MADHEFDVFISYTHEKAQWVKEHLAGPLNSCRTADGRAPKVFIDTESLHGGVNFMERIVEAINNSAVALLVFSRDYFSSKYCLYEAQKAFGRDPVGAQRKTIPLLIEASMEELSVHTAYKDFQAVDARTEGWFDKLVQDLSLRIVGRVQKLRFLSTIVEATAGETLPEVRVAIECDGERIEEDQTVTLLSDRSALQGTTSARTRNGIAVFNDLFLTSPVPATSLVATADGCEALFSAPFAVKPPRAIEPERKETLLPRGEPVFFDSSQAIAVFGQEEVRIFDLAGAPRGDAVALPPVIRLRKKVRDGLFVCGWSAEAVWIGADGTRRKWTLPDATGYRVPGDACESGNDVLLGFWSGDIYRLGDDGEVALAHRHSGGVQSLASRNGEMFIADLDGKLFVYREGKTLHSAPLEPTIRTMKLFADSLVIVGERKMYTFGLSSRQLLDVALPIELAVALSVGERVVAVAADGKGVVIDQRLALQGFHAWPGAVPRSADARGAFCVFRNPDRTSSLLHRGRMVLHYADGALTVSPSGEWVAAEEDRGIRILPARSLVTEPAGE